jgi:hypothetical protein
MRLLLGGAVFLLANAVAATEPIYSYQNTEDVGRFLSETNITAVHTPSLASVVFSGVQSLVVGIAVGPPLVFFGSKCCQPCLAAERTDCWQSRTHAKLLAASATCPSDFFRATHPHFCLCPGAPLQLRCPSR